MEWGRGLVYNKDFEVVMAFLLAQHSKDTEESKDKQLKTNCPLIIHPEKSSHCYLIVMSCKL